MFLQVTHFKCGGACLGVGLHHTLAVATSTFHFINAWAEMTRGFSISNLPFTDRKIPAVGVPTSPKFHHIEFDPTYSINAPTQNPKLQSNPEPVSSSILNLSVDQIKQRSWTYHYQVYQV